MACYRIGKCEKVLCEIDLTLVEMESDLLVVSFAQSFTCKLIRSKPHCKLCKILTTAFVIQLLAKLFFLTGGKHAPANSDGVPKRIHASLVIRTGFKVDCTRHSCVLTMKFLAKTSRFPIFIFCFYRISKKGYQRNTGHITASMLIN